MALCLPEGKQSAMKSLNKKEMSFTSNYACGFGEWRINSELVSHLIMWD